MRSVALALLLGGCLIVRADEVPLDEPCPTSQPSLLAAASGPFVLGDAIYFVGGSGMLTRLSYAGGPPAELTTEPVLATRLAYDGALYWTTETEVLRLPVTGGAPAAIVSGYPNGSVIAVDDSHVVWATTTGLQRWSKADQMVEMLDTGDLFLGLAIYEGVAYYSVTSGELVRRAPPTETIAAAHFPGPLVVDEAGVYYYEAADPFLDHAGMLRLVPRDGGEPVTTADGLARVYDLASDDTNLYLATSYGDEYRIQQVSRFGGEVHTLACGDALLTPPPLSVAADPSGVYFADGRGLYHLDRATLPR